MRHFPQVLPISALPLGVRAATLAAALVAMTGGAERRAPSLGGAAVAAVAVAAVAVPAEEEDLTARRPRTGRVSQ
jgi:hypothetical protein